MESMTHIALKMLANGTNSPALVHGFMVQTSPYDLSFGNADLAFLLLAFGALSAAFAGAIALVASHSHPITIAPNRHLLGDW